MAVRDLDKGYAERAIDEACASPGATSALGCLGQRPDWGKAERRTGCSDVRAATVGRGSRARARRRLAEHGDGGSGAGVLELR